MDVDSGSNLDFPDGIVVVSLEASFFDFIVHTSYLVASTTTFADSITNSLKVVFSNSEEHFT